MHSGVDGSRKTGNPATGKISRRIYIWWPYLRNIHQSYQPIHLISNLAHKFLHLTYVHVLYIYIDIYIFVYIYLFIFDKGVDFGCIILQNLMCLRISDMMRNKWFYMYIRFYSNRNCFLQGDPDSICTFLVHWRMR